MQSAIARRIAHNQHHNPPVVHSTTEPPAAAAAAAETVSHHKDSHRLPPPSDSSNRPPQDTPAAALNEPPPGRIDAPSASLPSDAAASASASAQPDHSMDLPRDSHDLSYNQHDGASTSLVDNMLMSLDRYTPTTSSSMPPPPPPHQLTADERRLYGSFHDDDDTPLASSSSRFSFFKNSRRRGHTQSSSHSSDVTGRFSVGTPERRRNNSTSTQQSALGKIGDINGKGRIDSQRAAPPAERNRHSRQRRSTHGSKGSGYSSLDLSSDRNRFESKPWLADQRRASFDRVFGGERITHSSPAPFQQQQQQQTVPPHSSNFDAAPTPTIRQGPSRPQSPSAFPPHPQHPPPQTPPIERKRSTRSSKSHFGRKGYFNRKGSTRVKPDGSPRSLNISSSRAAMPAMVHTDPAAPSPTIPFEKPVPYIPPEPPATQRGKPGFFRRMFSSTRTPANEPIGNDEPESWLRQARERQVSRAESSTGLQTGTSTPPSEPAQSAATLPLGKKSSSFFKRRRKSVVDLFDVPPAPPLPSQPSKPEVDTKTESKSGEQDQGQSPVSSLRKVMNPYLENPEASSEAEAFFDTREHFQTPDGSDSGQTRNNSVSYFPENGRSTVRVVSNESKDLVEKPQDPTEKTAEDEKDARSSEATPRLKSLSGSPAAASVRTPSPLARERMPTRPPPPEPAAPASAQTPAASPTPRAPKSDLSIKPTPIIVSNDAAAPLSSPMAASTVESASSPRSPKVFLDAPSSPLDKKSHSGNDGLSASPKASKDSVIGSQSEVSDYKSVSSIPVVQMNDEPVVEGEDDATPAELPKNEKPVIDESVVMDVIDTAVPSEDDRAKAKSVFDGEEDVVPKAKAAAWMGESTSASSRIRIAYMELFDWSNLNILASLRILCEKLILKGETQQVDRILDSFTDRWCACNPSHGFKSRDIVHTICYSLLLLNTDLHLADIEQKMTKSQFVKNTMPTIRKVAAELAKEAEFDARDGSKMLALPLRSSTLVSEPPSPLAVPKSHSSTFPIEVKDSRSSIEVDKPSFRLSARPSALASFDDSQASTPLDFDVSADDCGPLVKTPFNGSLRTWEVQVEVVLKSFFTSIRNKRLPLHGAPTHNHPDEPSNPSLLGASNTTSAFRRTPSVLSKTPSETASYRGRPESSRLTGPGGRWSSKTRSRPRISPASNVFGSSSRTSLDEQSSIWSPSASSIWSKNSFGKTQTSMSIDSYGSTHHSHAKDFHQSIGFANALSQAIVREESTAAAALAAGSSKEDVDDGHLDDEPASAVPLLEDDTLGLAGAPWAKEGILKHKHYLETVDKKAKDRNWNEAFAVIEKGWLRLFSFTGKSSTSSMRSKKGPNKPGAVVGGGNWAESASQLGSFLLRQTIASALPPPGYSKSRPHVWALSFPTGAVHLFSVGTPDIVKEFVATANYWSARLSKEPLVGAISNIEYGWSENVVSPALIAASASSDGPAPTASSRPPSSAAPRPSLQSSIRSSIDHNASSSTRHRLPGDRLVLSDWQPPQQSMMASALLEVDQHRALTSYVSSIEAELARHNELRPAMQLAFSPRHANATKAMANWERKSSYLVVEVIKFKTYVECLALAGRERERVYAEREERRREKDGEIEADVEKKEVPDLGETALPGLPDDSTPVVGKVGEVVEA